MPHSIYHTSVLGSEWAFRYLVDGQAAFQKVDMSTCHHSRSLSNLYKTQHLEGQFVIDMSIIK